MGRLLWRFAVPAITGMVVNALYNVVDRIFVGRGVGTLAIAATTVGFPVMILMMALPVLVGVGATALVSIRLGERRHDEAARVAGNAMVLLVATSLTASALALIWLRPLLVALGATEAVLPYAVRYLRIILPGSVFMTLGFGLSHLIRAEGQPVLAMTINLVGAVSNVVLDYLFIFPLGMGIEGAAIATVIAQALSAAWALHYYLSGRSVLKLQAAHLAVDVPTCRAIVALGVPQFMLQLVGSVQQTILNRSLALYGGDLAIAAMGVVFSLVAFLFMPVVGIAQAAGPIISYNHGAGQRRRVHRALGLASLWATIVVTAGYVVTRLWPEALVALFGKGDEALVAMGTQTIAIAFLALPVVGFQVIGSSYFQATGKPRQATVLTLSRQLLLLMPLLLVLPRLWGLAGIWWSLPLADLGSAALTAIWLYRDLVKGARAETNPAGQGAPGV